MEASDAIWRGAVGQGKAGNVRCNRASYDYATRGTT